MSDEGDNTPNAIDLNSTADRDDLDFDERGNYIDLKVRQRQQQIQLDTLEDLQQQRKEEFEVNIKLRRQFAYVMVVLVGISNLITLAILLLDGFGLLGFDLSDAVILAAIGATVAELASIFLIIVKYLFQTDTSWIALSGYGMRNADES